MTDRTLTTASYTGSSISIISALTLTDIGIIVGIATALATLLLNAIHHYRREQREREAHAIRVEVLRGEAEDRRRASLPVALDRRRACADVTDCPYNHD